MRNEIDRLAAQDENVFRCVTASVTVDVVDVAAAKAEVVRLGYRAWSDRELTDEDGAVYRVLFFVRK